MFVSGINVRNVTISSSLHTEGMFLSLQWTFKLHVSCMSWFTTYCNSASVALCHIFLLSIHQLCQLCLAQHWKSLLIILFISIQSCIFLFYLIYLLDSLSIVGFIFTIFNYLLDSTWGLHYMTIELDLIWFVQPHRATTSLV